MELLVKDNTLEKMLPKFAQAAKYLQSECKGRQVQLFYHNDADGVCAAICMCNALEKITGELKAQASVSATYNRTDAQQTISGGSNAQPCVFIFLDFASNEQSAEGLEALKQNAPDARLVLIDHHPLSEKTRKLYDFVVTQFDFGATINYSAGVLCAHIANLMDEDASGAGFYRQLAQLSLVADKSSLVAHTKEVEKLAQAIDFAASRGKGHALTYFQKMIESEEAREPVLEQLAQKEAETEEAAREFAQVKKIGRFEACIVDMDKIEKKYRVASRAKALDEIFWHLNKKREGKAFCAIGFASRLVTFRANQQAVAEGFAATKIVEHIKENLKGAVDSGGGHDSAASMRLNTGFGNLVKEEVLSYLKKA